MKVPPEISSVARYLGELRDQVVFVGGMVRGLLVSDPAVVGPRATKDVDVILSVPNLAAFSEKEAELRRLGFKDDPSEDAPICRKVLPGESTDGGALPVDFMPLDPAVLGFSNVWYPDAFDASQRIPTEVGEIRVIDAPHFVATKLESFNSRGKGDHWHHDVEDVVVIVDGCPELIAALRAAPEELRLFVAAEFELLLADSEFMETLPGHLPPDAASQQRLGLVVSRMRAIAALQRESNKFRPARLGPLPYEPPISSPRIRQRGHAALDDSTGWWRPAFSSNIAGFKYDLTRGVLTVQFRKGTRYEYSNVPQTIFEGFKTAGSSGRYFHLWIRDRYDVRSIS